MSTSGPAPDAGMETEREGLGLADARSPREPWSASKSCEFLAAMAGGAHAGRPFKRLKYSMIGPAWLGKRLLFFKTTAICTQRRGNVL